MTMEDKVLDIGSVLAAKRKAAGHTLEEAAEQTRIRKTYLESLEANRFDDLPGRAYVVGFVKVYAGYLGLDAAPLLEELSAMTVVEPKLTRPVGALTRESRTNTRFRAGGWFLFLLGFVVVLLVGLGVYFLPGWLVSEEPVLQHETVTQTRDQVSQTPPDPLPSEPTEQSLPGTTDAPAAVATDQVSPGPTAPLPAETTDQIVGQAAGSSAPPVIPPVATPAAAGPESREQLAAAATPEPLPAIAKGGSSLRMLAIADGTLIIRVDGYPGRKYALREGLDLTWPIKRDVSVELGASGQARFWLDQQELSLGERTEFHLRRANAN